METQITKHINENPDSLEIGTPGKLGALKIYFDADELDLAQKKIQNALELRRYANNLIKSEETNL